jgi:hypothetical protein
MPRKSLKNRKNNNRISPLVKKLIGTETADDLMLKLTSILEETKEIPVVGQIYIFRYRAKTPLIRYDRHPLIQVTNVYIWGFSGFNYHWNEIRQYTWDEIYNGMYEIHKNELQDLRRIPFGDIQLNI